MTPSATSSAQTGWVRAAPRPVSGTAGSSASRSRRARRRSAGAYTSEVASVVVGIPAPETACAGALGRPQQAPRREPVELRDAGTGLVALRAGQVYHGADAAQRVAER